MNQKTAGPAPEEKLADSTEEFAEQLTGFFRTGALPPSAKQPVRKELLLRKERLSAHGLSEELLLKEDDTLICDDGRGCTLPGKESSQQILHTGCRKDYLRKIIFRRECPQSRRKKKTFRDLTTLYALTEERNGGNCAVTEFHWEAETALSASRKKRNYLIYWLCAGALFALFGLICLLIQYDWAGFVLASMLGGCAVLVFWLGWYLLYLLAEFLVFTAGQIVRRQRWGKGCGVLFRIQKYDPSLSGIFLETAAVHLAALRIFQSQDPSDPFYEIVDTRYRGALQLCSFRQEDGGFSMVLELYVQNTLDSGRRLFRRREKLRMELFHRGAVLTEEAFAEDPFIRWELRKAERIK